MLLSQMLFIQTQEVIKIDKSEKKKPKFVNISSESGILLKGTVLKDYKLLKDFNIKTNIKIFYQVDTNVIAKQKNIH